MSEAAVPLSVDALHEQVAALDEAITRAERGEIVPVIAHGAHVADLVPAGELKRLRERIELLSGTEAMRELLAVRAHPGSRISGRP